MRTTVLLPTPRRSLVALLKATPRAFGWCRTRWRGAPLALTRQATRGVVVSAETRRRWLHESGWVGKRATRGAKADAPHRVERLAHMRLVYARWRLGEVMACADALDSHVRPTVGAAWRPKGTQGASMPPGTHAKHDLAGALHLATGTRHPCGGPRTTKGLCRDWLQTVEASDAAAQPQRLSVGVDHDTIHQAKAVVDWVAHHPRVTRLLWPPYGPRAHPIARACGDGHALCTRHQTRKR